MELWWKIVNYCGGLCVPTRDCECITNLNKNSINCNNVDKIINGLELFLSENKEFCTKHCYYRNVSNSEEMLCLQAWNLLVQIDTYCKEFTVDQTIYQSYQKV